MDAADLRVKILVVDDEPKVVQLIREKLESYGYGVVSAADGPQALAHAREQRLDLILLDLAMPLMNGLEVLTRLRASKATSQIPVVVVTAHNDTRSILKAKDLYVAEYITKPFDLDALLDAVRRSLGPPSRPA
jgi:CheY-like chemotaxis protein